MIMSNATGVSTWTTATWTSNSVSNSCKVSTCNNSGGYFISGNACIKITAANVSYTTTNNSSIANVEQALSDLYFKFG